MWTSRWVRWGMVLGFALGGFFDGILLHQILQWHHLLSLAPGMADLRLQVLWDGYFHALMYLIAALGLWGLWRARQTADETSGRVLGGALLVGFGLWHIVDSVLSHWLLGIHRINLQSDDPLFWDLFWFAVFGLAPLFAGWLLIRRGGSGGARVRASAAVLLLVGALTVGAGAVALRPPPDQPFTTIVFGPGEQPSDVMAVVASADARLVWADPAMAVVVVQVEPERRWEFYRRGAVLVSGSGLPPGCFDWSRV